MHSTRPRLDRAHSRLLFLATLAGAGIAVVACSTSDKVLGEADAREVDAGPGSPPDVEEAGTVDATKPPFEGKPLPVTCASEPCAVSLVTTLASDPDERAEGFCVLLSDGTVACWGANGAGQLGRGTDDDSALPERVAGLSNVVELDHTCAVLANGDVHCWGTGPFLQDPESTATITTARTPVKLPLPPARHIGIGHAVGCAALIDGRLLCWGTNGNGQLAPTWGEAPPASEPIAIPLPSGAPIRRVLVGAATLVLRDDGTLLSWGGNASIGRPSSLSPDPIPAPIDAKGILGVDVAHDDACLVAGGAASCWGSPLDPTTSSPLDRAIPEHVYTPEPVVDVATTRTIVVTGRTYPHRWCAVAHDGDVYCRGTNDDGQVGDGSLEDALLPKRVADLPAPASRVKVTPSTSCALFTDGTVRCWGSNSFGQLGSGQNRGRSPKPVEVLLP